MSEANSVRQKAGSSCAGGFAERGQGWTFLHEKHWEIHLILNGSSLDVHLVNQRAFMIM